MNQSYGNLDDSTLIAQTIAGDLEAFGSLIDRYQPRLFNAMVHFLRDQVDAEDVVQDAFVLAMTKLDSFKGNSQFYTWLYRIAHNAAISKLRKKRPTVSLEGGKGDESSPGFAIPDDGAAPGERLEKEEQIQALMDGMERLSEQHRSILILREMEGMDYEAIAEVLQLPVGTVRSRLHRARSTLREIMETIEKQP